MSAIFGIINKKQKCVDNSLVDKMLEALKHRATDGSQIVVNKNMGMGNCRLNVYPQQIYEKQPLKIGQFTITSDARIDNRQELARHFNIDNDLLNVTPDSTLILMAYQEWEDMCINHLEGEFAFAIWDEKAEKLFAATDQIGFRPLYYYDTPDAFIFCSEIKGITAIKTTPNFFNEESLIEYFYREGDWQQTFNKEILSLCGGNTLIMKEGKLAISKYWKLEPANRYHFTKDEEWYECFHEILYKAIEKQLNPENITGITLSGGLDSTSIACIVAEILMKKNKPLYAFSTALSENYNGKEKDERDYIEMVGKFCPNIIQTYLNVDKYDLFGDVAKGFESDEMIPNPFIYIDLALAKAAQDKKVKKIFNGFGGDYWASWKGNSVVYMLIKQGKWKEALELIKEVQRVEGKSFGSEIKNKYLRYTKLYNKIRSVIKSDEIYWEKNLTFREDYMAERRASLNYTIEPDKNEQMTKLINSGSPGRILSLFYNRNAKFGMDCGTPMLDKHVMEFLIEMPVQLFSKGGRKRELIRHSMKGFIPDAILERQNKMAYIPNYMNEIDLKKDKIRNMLELPEYEFIYQKYLKRDMIINHFDNKSKMDDTSKITIDLNISQVLMSCKTLQILKDDKYI